MRRPADNLALWLACLLTAVCMAISVQARDHTPLATEEILSASHFPDDVSVNISPTGEWIAFTLQDARRRNEAGEPRYSWITRTGAPAALSGSAIWLLNTRTGNSRRLSSDTATSWSPVWSPDGRYLAFNSDLGGEARVWLWEKSSKKLRELRVSVSSGFVFDGVQWTPDSKRFVVRTFPDGLGFDHFLDLLYGKPEKSQVGKPDKSHSVTVVEFHPSSASETEEPIAAKRSKDFDLLLSDLVIVDIRTMRIRTIQRRVRPIFYTVSPVGKFVAVMSFARSPAVNSAQALWSLSLSSLDIYESRTLAADMEWDLRPLSWSPNGRNLAYSNTNLQGTTEVVVQPVYGGTQQRSILPADFVRSNTYCFEGCPWLWDATGGALYSVANNTVWKLTLNPASALKLGEIQDHEILELVGRGAGSQLWQSAQEKFALVVTRNVHTFAEGLFQVDLRTGSLTKLWEEPKYYRRQSHRIVESAADGKSMVFLSEDAQNCEDLWALSGYMRQPRQITNINPAISTHLLGASQLISWRSSEGDELKGALLLPAGYEPGKRYPLVVYVYGGERLSTGLNQWTPGIFNMQLLATRGYAVLFPDAPLNVGTPFKDLAATVLPGIQKTIDMGIVDPERLGVMGHSYGGYSALALIEQSQEFRAAVDMSGETNLVNAYAKTGSAGGIGWVEEGQGRMGGSLWQYPTKFMDNSPVFRFDKVKTPVLIIQGGIDSDVPPIESDIAFQSLRRLDKEVTYVRYEGEEHDPINWGYEDQRDYINRIITWFGKYLK
jgi:dipeptidyl aminopeptidase/acylaminoacyl peptidase